MVQMSIKALFLFPWGLFQQYEPSRLRAGTAPGGGVRPLITAYIGLLWRQSGGDSAQVQEKCVSTGSDQIL